MRVNRTQSCNEMVFPGVDCSFSSVGSVLVSWHKLAFHVGLRECILEFLQCLIVHAMHVGFESCLTEVVEDVFMSFCDLVGCSVLDGDAPDEVGIVFVKNQKVLVAQQ